MYLKFNRQFQPNIDGVMSHVYDVTNELLYNGMRYFFLFIYIFSLSQQREEDPQMSKQTNRKTLR